MRKLLSWTIVLLIHKISSSVSVYDNDNCSATNNTKEFKLTCMESMDTFKGLDLTTEQRKVTLKCVGSINFNLFPPVDLSYCEEFFMDLCDTRSYFRFNDILNKFRIKNMTSLILRLRPLEQKTAVTKELFSSLYNLKELRIIDHELSISKDFLANTPNLLFLKLKKVGLNQLEGFFKFTPSLKVVSLSFNSINLLSNESFAGIAKLETLNLHGNRIRVLTRGVFAELKKLEILDLGRNEIQYLSDDTFSDLIHLKELRLEENKLRSISQALFRENPLLMALYLDGNAISDLSQKAFRSCTQLTDIRMHNISLHKLPDGIFHGLTKLAKLDLSANNLETVFPEDFRTLSKLAYLDLSLNQMKSVDMSWFNELCNLKYLKMSRNKISKIKDGFLSKPCFELETFKMKRNELRIYPKQFNVHVKHMDISFNQLELLKIEDVLESTISQVDLRNNRIGIVEFPSPHSKPGKLDEYQIFLQANPIVCNCSNYHLVKHNRSKRSGHFKLKTDRICSGDSALRDITCPIHLQCPRSCSCHHRPFSHETTVNCSHKNLTAFPVWQSFHEVGEHGNKWTITHLDLSNNALTELKWIPSFVQVIYLNGNRFTNLKREFLELVKNTTTLRRIHFEGNPWRCNCDSSELQFFLKSEYSKIDPSDIYCENLQKQLSNVDDICSNPRLHQLFTVVIFGTCIFIATVVSLSRCYATRIKTYLTNKNWYHWRIDEELLDKDKKYDLFVSYAHQDESFVLGTLLGRLENDEPPLKVCVHVRDWVPGEEIAKQAIGSVKGSRKTLVVLSEHFLDSAWGKLEFKMAHAEGLSEGRARVIVVLFGNVDENKLDEDLKSYLRTNTYVKWGEKYFWEKLNDALPRRAGRNRGSSGVNNFCSTSEIILDPSVLQKV